MSLLTSVSGAGRALSLTVDTALLFGDSVVLLLPVVVCQVYVHFMHTIAVCSFLYLAAARGALLFLKKLEEETQQRPVAGTSHGTSRAPGFGLMGAQGGGLGSDALPPKAFILSLKAYYSALAGELTEAEEMLEEVQKGIEKAMGMDPVVRGSWHKAKAELARVSASVLR